MTNDVSSGYPRSKQVCISAGLWAEAELEGKVRIGLEGKQAAAVTLSDCARLASEERSWPVDVEIYPLHRLNEAADELLSAIRAMSHADKEHIDRTKGSVSCGLDEAEKLATAALRFARGNFYYGHLNALYLRAPQLDGGYRPSEFRFRHDNPEAWLRLLEKDLAQIKDAVNGAHQVIPRGAGRAVDYPLLNCVNRLRIIYGDAGGKPATNLNKGNGKSWSPFIRFTWILLKAAPSLRPGTIDALGHFAHHHRPRRGSLATPTISV
jgi:hypothetical protein